MTGLAAGIGIDPIKLLFKWDLTRLVLPEQRIELKDQVLNLRNYLGRKSQVLSFSEKLVRDSVENAEAFVAACTDYVIAALRRLNRPEKRRAKSWGFTRSPGLLAGNAGRATDNSSRMRSDSWPGNSPRRQASRRTPSRAER